MTTERLFDLDSHIFEFAATVLSCEEKSGKFYTVLDKTAFFPEAGGQYGDRGVIENANVLDTQIKDGIIYHITDAPLAVGASVYCKLDRKRRFGFMQNHSGEHIVSGLVYEKFGFQNVGFHLGEELATLDFDGMLDRKSLDEIERLANERVWQNLDVRAYCPTADELKKINYRSKKELEGDIRIVEIENTDICACCAPHVKKTGEIGLIKLLLTEKMRGGTRIGLKCGGFALSDYQNKFSNITDISVRLSAKPENAAAAVQVLEDKLKAEKAAANELKRSLCSLLVSSAEPSVPYVFAEGLDRVALCSLADRLYRTYGGVRAAFSPENGGFTLAFCGQEGELSALFGRFKSCLNVRGGGRGEMVQGSVSASRDDIEKFFTDEVK